MPNADKARPADAMLETLQGIPVADQRRTRTERVDVSPMGTEGCLWDEDHYVWEGQEGYSEAPGEVQPK